MNQPIDPNQPNSDTFPNEQPATQTANDTAGKAAEFEVQRDPNARPATVTAIAIISICIGVSTIAYGFCFMGIPLIFGSVIESIKEDLDPDLVEQVSASHTNWFLLGTRILNLAINFALIVTAVAAMSRNDRNRKRFVISLLLVGIFSLIAAVVESVIPLFWGPKIETDFVDDSMQDLIKYLLLFASVGWALIMTIMFVVFARTLSSAKIKMWYQSAPAK